MWSWTVAIRATAFALHFAAACVLAALLFACHTQNYTNTGYRMEVLDWQSWDQRGGNCSSAAQCTRQGVPWADDEQVRRHRWNPFALVSAFEFISSAFALFYLGFAGAKYWAVGWMLVGFCVYLAWFGSRGEDQWGEALAIAASYVFGAAVILSTDRWREELYAMYARYGQAQSRAAREVRVAAPAQRMVVMRIPRLRGGGAPEPDEPAGPAPRPRAVNPMRFGVVLRYLEYTATASLLYLAVLSVFSVGPPSWAFVAGFAGIFACNISGVPLHILHIIAAAEAAGRPRWHQSAAAVLGVGTWKEKWVAEIMMLEAAWFGLAVGITIVLYLGFGVLTNPAIPVYVLVGMWDVLVLYCSFGIAGTVFYAFDSLWEYMEPTLDVLSLAAKLPIAVAVGVAFLQEPGGGCGG